MLFSACNGIKTNWSTGISTPMIQERNGILNTFWATGTGACKILPYDIWHWGIVGDNIG